MKQRAIDLELLGLGEKKLMLPIVRRKQRLKRKKSPLYAEYREFCRICAGLVNARRIMVNYTPAVVYAHGVAMDGTLGSLVAGHYCKGKRDILSSHQRWEIPLTAYSKLVELHKPIVDVLTMKYAGPSEDKKVYIDYKVCQNQLEVLACSMLDDKSFTSALLGSNPQLYAMSHLEALKISIEHAFLLVNNSPLPIYFGIGFTYSDLLATCFSTELRILEICPEHGTKCPCSRPTEERKAEAHGKFRALLLYSLKLQGPWIYESTLRLFTIDAMLLNDPELWHCEPSDYNDDPKEDDPAGLPREVAVAAARWAFWPSNYPLLGRLHYIERLLTMPAPVEKLQIVRFLAQHTTARPPARLLEDYILQRPCGNLVESVDALSILRQEREPAAGGSEVQSMKCTDLEDLLDAANIDQFQAVLDTPPLNEMGLRPELGITLPGTRHYKGGRVPNCH